jgi:acyl carrier protein
VLAEKTTLDANKKTLAAFIEFADSIKTGPTLLQIDDLLRGKLQKLEDTMRATLPRYMVPSLWIPVSKMPSLAASGKTDRKMLAGLFKDLDAAQLAMYGLVDSAQRTIPSGDAVTEMETTILGLVARHLGRDPHTIYPDDSFVRLGGDSITAIQLVSAARAMGITLATEDILRQPKLRDIARNAKTSDGNTETEVAAIEPYSMLKDKEGILKNINDEYDIPASAISDVLPCTPLQEGLIALTVKDPEAYVLRETYRLPSKLDLNRFKAAWAVVAQDVCLLRTRIVNLEGHGCLQIVMENNSEWQLAKSVKEYMEVDDQSPFKYGVPLCKLGTVETPYSGTYFMFTIHHSLYDGWSKGLIMQKVAEAYEYVPPFYKVRSDSHRIQVRYTSTNHFSNPGFQSVYPVSPRC